ncbi:polyadenylate-binding protein-interacting protein 7 [Silene latifolia]|uniref:polyadenylate-binding protein-interacting protein 7 n=1 Tax=Silene latifolia TaxID=37657 RepID=UPI003D76D427
MSLSKQVSPTAETKLRAFTRGTSLNPNAAEFVPFSLRSSASSPIPDKLPASASSGKQILDRSESSISANSDDEARQYWQQQLPDDITPDFNVGEDDHASLSLEGLSLHAASEENRFAAAGATGYMMNGHPEFSPNRSNATAFSNKLGYSLPMYGDNPSSTSFLQRNSKPWEMQHLAPGHHLGNGSDGSSFNESTTHINPNNLDTDAALAGDNNMNPVEFLASQFPGFAVESLAEVYFANCCDLNLTFEMLAQLELQVDGVTNQNMNVKTVSAPNLTSTDFPSLPVPDNKTNLQKYTGDELQQTINPYGFFDKDNLLLFKSSPSLSAKSATDFASAVRKLASQDSGFWKYDRNGSADAAIGSSRSSQTLAGLYNSGAGRSFSDRTQGRGSARAAPAWLETGDAVANLYTEVREEARDRARLRNAYFEQARQAYLIGNKALAKELSVKGQAYNLQMKAAHCKAGESIYRERNPISPRLQSGGGGGRNQDVIDLHGLHVNEAIQMLKLDLNKLRNEAARLGEHRRPVYICVGTGHHTRGSRTPARLPIAVQRYLLQEEGLDYTEPQPGLLRVVLY